MKFTIAKSNNPISKKFSLENDKLVKNDGGNLTLATFDTQKDLNIRSLHDYVKSDSCHDRVILIPGTSEFQDGLIVTKAEIARRVGSEDSSANKQKLVSRSKECFAYRGGEGFILLDYDPSEDYYQNEGKPLSKDYLLSILLDVLPELREAPMFWKTSSSSYIYKESQVGLDEDGNADPDEELRGLTGQHIFIAVEDSLDIPRIIDVFYKRLWLNGHGYIFTDKTGRMHDRSVIDKVVNSPEREIFLKAECVSPVKQKPQYDLINEGAKPLNTRVISDLTMDETLRVQALIDDQKGKKSKDADKIMQAYVKTMASKIGMSQLKLIECIKNRVLFGDTHIKLSNGVEVTVHDLFEDPDKYDGEYCYDPLEPEYGGVSGGSTKAWIDLGNKRIHGHAHGGIHYDLEMSDRKSPKQLALEVCDTQDHNILFKLAAIGAQKMRYIHTEIDQLIEFISKFAELKKSSADKAFKEKFRLLTGNDFTSAGVNLDLHSDALNEDGSLGDGMGQINLSVPIHHQFPHTYHRGENEFKLDTIENFEFMCKIYDMYFSYDVVLKSPEITFPNGEIQEGDNHMNASLSRIKSLCVLNGLGKDSVNYVIEMMNANQKNPVFDWIKRVKWDGHSRMRLVQDNIDIAAYGDNEDDQINMDFSNSYKLKATRMWFLQCVAAIDGAVSSPLSGGNGIAVPKFEYILVFVGGQGIQKTKFIKSLLPVDLNQYILTGHELDVKDKDNVKIAISHWITELGELDSTFRKSDISALKAFMSKEEDQMRMPYARGDSKFKRRSSFCGTVNEVRFLVDNTGNRRYLPMEVLGMKPFYQIYVPWVTEDGKPIEVIKGIGEGLNSFNDEDKEDEEDNGKRNAAVNGKTGELCDGEEGKVDIFGREIDDIGGNSNVVESGGGVNNSLSDSLVESGWDVSDGAKHSGNIGFDCGFVDGLTKDNSVYGIVDGVEGRYKCGMMSENRESQQFWAEIYHYYLQGEQWWPSESLENDLGYIFGEHKRVDPIIDGLVEKFDLSFTDKIRDKGGMRGARWTDSEGVTHRFVVFNYRDLTNELGFDGTNIRYVNSISNYLSGNGIKPRVYKVDGKSIRGVRLCLRRGYTLNSDMGVMVGGSGVSG